MSQEGRFRVKALCKTLEKKFGEYSSITLFTDFSGTISDGFGLDWEFESKEEFEKIWDSMKEATK